MAIEPMTAWLRKNPATPAVVMNRFCGDTSRWITGVARPSGARIATVVRVDALDRHHLGEAARAEDPAEVQLGHAAPAELGQELVAAEVHRVIGSAGQRAHRNSRARDRRRMGPAPVR